MKIKNLTTIILAAMISIAVFLSCANGGYNPPNGADDNTLPQSTNMSALINGFDTQKDFDTIYIGNYLGRVSLNKDKQFITQGDNSAKVEVIGNKKATTLRPFIYQALEQPYKDKDLTNFDRIKSLTLNVYNANTAMRNVYIQAELSSGNTSIKEYPVKEGGWTQITHLLDRRFLPEWECYGIYIYFDATDGTDVFYLDGMMLHYTDATYTPLEIKLDEDEICSFDKLYQTELAWGYSGNPNPTITPLLAASGFTKDGQGFSLKVTAIAGNNNEWPKVYLYSPMIQKVDWSSYGPDDELCFEVYLDADVPDMRIQLIMDNSQDQRFFADYSVTIGVHQWTTVRTKVSQLNNHYYGAKIPEDERFVDTASIGVHWREFPGKDRTLYFDNFRMERSS